MEVNRRSFMKTVGAGAALGVGTVGIPTGKTWNQPGITANDLRPHIGQQFQAVCPESGNAMTLILSEVQTNAQWERTQTGRPRPSGLRQPFTLTFKARHKHEVEDGLYNVSHPNLRTANLFLSRNDQTGRTIEVCFS